MYELDISGLSLGYSRDTPIFTGLNGKISGTGLYLLTGKNGAGKSTLLEAIAGYLRPLAGQINFSTHEPGRDSSAALVRTAPSLVPFLTVGDNLRLFTKRFGADRDQLDRDIAELELEPHLNKLSHEVSTGTLRKAWLLCGLQLNHGLIGFDEPFNGLDAESTDYVCARIAELGKRAMVIVVSHVVPPAWTATEAAVPLCSGGEQLMTVRRLDATGEGRRV